MSRLADIKSLPMSESTRKLNAHLFAQRAGGEVPFTASRPIERGRRLRQSAAPLMNKLEERLLAHLLQLHPGVKFRPQAKRYRLANGLWYKPDFTGIIAGVEHAFEAKGPRAFRGGFENLKIAASQWPEVTFLLMWEDGAAWRIQRILP